MGNLIDHMLLNLMKTSGQQLADARDRKAQTLAKLAQLDNAEMRFVKGMPTNHARDILLQNIADDEAIISKLE